MRTNKTTVFDVARATQKINSVVKHASVYGIAKIIGVTPPRAKCLVDNAVDAGVIFPYDLSRCSKGTGVRYSITDAGLTCVDAVRTRKENRLI